jgi:DNA cross-link repair 1A protein
MSNNSEDKAWKAAAVTEQLRGIRAAIRPCPFYKIMPEMPGFAVDAFRYGRVEGIRGYFLTHFHSDHYGGMTANWSHGPIYCSSITASLVLQQIKVNPEYVVKLPMYQPVNIDGVDVTLIDANQYSLYDRWS